MNRLSKPNQLTDTHPEDAEPLDVSKLLDKGAAILRREITNLMRESSSGKLSPGSARDLVQYLRLLHELKAEQQEQLANLTDEELLNLTKID